MNGLIFNIKLFSIHDGPGIRVTIFMKGCPLNCLWCHNPEGQSPDIQKVEKINRIGSREFREKEDAGKLYSIDSIVSILEKEKVFIDQSGGGVTFSGGEPLFQYDFLLNTLEACKLNGYHTAVDTSGYSSVENFRSLLPFTDLFLFDIKHLDDDKHIKLTGVSNKIILENYLMLLDSGKNVIARIPVIPGLNDEPEHLIRLKDFIKKTKTLSLKRINLLPYHKTGSAKYNRFNIPWNMKTIDPPDNEKMQKIRDLFMDTGVRVKIGG